VEVLTNKITDVITSNIDTDKPIPEELTGNETVVSETKDSTVNKDTGDLEFTIVPNPKANVTPDIKPLVEESVATQEQQRLGKQVTPESILSGETIEINGEEISPNLVAKANQGDIDALSEIESIARSFKKERQEPIVAKAPEVFANDPQASKTTEKLVKYTEGRNIVLNALQKTNPATNEPRIVDSRVQQLFVDYYSTGQFFTEMSRRLAESGRGITLLPVLGHMAMNVFGAAKDAADLPFAIGDIKPDDETFAQSWEKRQPGMAKFFNQYKTMVEKALPGLTQAQTFNDDIKKLYIETYGQEEYDKYYTLTVGDKTVDLPIVNDELAQELLKIGFNELPMVERAAAMIIENVGIGYSLAKGATTKGGKQFTTADEIRQSNPYKYKGLSNVEVLRVSRIDNASNAFTKAWYQTTANIGRKLKNKGAIGAYEVDLNAENTLNLIDKQVDSVQKQIKKLDPKDVGNAREIALLEKQLKNLEVQRIKHVMPFTKNTYARNVIIDETIMGMGQAMGYEIANHYGFDTDVGEVFGALSTATNVPQFLIKKGVGGPLKFLDRLAGGAVSNFAATIEMIPIIPKGIFIDRRFDLLTDEFGNALTGKEKLAVEEVAKIVKNLEPSQREMVWASINEYQQVRNRILQRFTDPQRKEEARKLFQLSFAQISGLAPLMALEKRAAGRLKASASNIGEAVDYQIAQENSLLQANEAITQLKRMMNEEAGIDLDNGEFVNDFVNNFQKAANDTQLSINETKIEYMESLQQYKNAIIQNPDQPLDEDLITKLAEMEIKLTAGATQNLELQRSIYAKTTEDVMKALKDRGDNIIALRGQDGYKEKMGRYIEDVYDAQQDKLDSMGRLIYKPVDDLDIEMDIRSVVDDMLDRKDQLSSSAVRNLFSPEGDFFRGASGRKARSALDSMAVRGIQKQLELDKEQFGELMTYHRNPLTAKEAPDDFLGETATPLDVALHLSRREGSGFNPFVGKPSELDAMRGHFLRVAKGLEKSNPQLGKQYTDFANTIEGTIKANPEVYSQIQSARSQYRAIHFDPIRKGSYGDKIDNARTGPAYVEPAEGGYKYPYKNGLEPENFHEDFGKNIEDLMNNKMAAKRSLKKNMEGLVRFWTAGDMPDNSLVFDVSTPAGQKKLEVVSNLVKASLYEHWGESRKAVIDRIKGKVAGGYPVRVSEYNFEAGQNIAGLQDIFTVKVKDADGNIQPRQLFDLADIVQEEKDIVKLVGLSRQAENQYNKLTTELNDNTSLLMTRANAVNQIENKAVNQLEKIAGIRDSEQFYTNYIEFGSPNYIRDIRKSYVDARKLEEGVTEETALKEFKSGVMYHIGNALLKRAGLSSGERTLTGFDGQPFKLNVLTDAGQLSADLNNTNTQKILREVGFDKDHIQYLDDIGTYMQYAQGASLQRFDITGKVRDVSPNELISRAFNLARGMVSPTYVAGEITARLAIQKGNELVLLAARSKDGARIIGELLKNPRNVSPDDVKTFGTLVKEFLATELARTGAKAPGEYISEDDMTEYNIEYQGKPIFEGIFNSPKKEENNETQNKENTQ
jgi:hypothetical protein